VAKERGKWGVAVKANNSIIPCKKVRSNPTTGLVVFGVSGRLRLQNF
jgi:hypothetical protein